MALCYTLYSYRWLMHSWTKDRFKILFFQPMVAVTVDVSPVCELGEHYMTIHLLALLLCTCTQGEGLHSTVRIYLQLQLSVHIV